MLDILRSAALLSEDVQNSRYEMQDREARVSHIL
jgi:hypothetical protein